MNSVSFHTEEFEPQHTRSRTKNSLSAWLVSHSFGYIKTETHATVVQVIFIVAALLFIALISSREDEYVIHPSPDLINAPQPREEFR